MLKSIKTIILTNSPTTGDDFNEISAYAVNGYMRKEKKRKYKTFEENETSSYSSSDIHSRGEVMTLTYHLMYIPRIIKNDLRRQYPTMFANVYNTCDYDLMMKFLNEFCDYSTRVTMTDSYVKDDPSHTLRAETKGIELCRAICAFRMNDAPDVCIQLQTVQIRLRSDGTCTCEARHTYSGTSILYVNPKKIPKILRSCKVNDEGILVLPNLPSPGIFVRQTQVQNPETDSFSSSLSSTSLSSSSSSSSSTDELLISELKELYEIDHQLLSDFVHSLQGEEEEGSSSSLDEESEYLYRVFTDFMHPERLTPSTPNLEETLPLGFPFEYIGDLIFRLNEESKIIHVDITSAFITKPCQV